MEKIGEILKKKFPVPQTILKSIEEMELTAEEQAEAILKAKTNKYWQIQEELQHAKKLKLFEEATRSWTTEETFKNALQEAKKLTALSGKEYLMDHHILPVFNLLAQYFANDPAFERNDRSLSKGIMLIGDVGVGKTDLLKSFSKNRRQCYLPVTCNEIEAKCRAKGIDYWKTYTGPVPGHGSTPEYFFQPYIGWMFDDLGTEEVIKDYGNTLDSLEKIIHMRYMLKETTPFYSLHITTNMNGEMLERRYGYRMRSRIREMFNIIKLPGTDRRS